MNLLTIILVIASVALAFITTSLVRANLRHFRRLPPAPWPGSPRTAISILIPARDEERVIRASVAAALASRGVQLEVLVLDDRSEDATAEIVQAMARLDDRVRLIRGPELPPGWCGKQHACWVLAGEARHPLLVFLDADVKLEPEGLARMATFLEDSGADLASGFPRQETVGLLEQLVIPLMHFILLGFLPIERMRQSLDPAFAAGCGQLFITRRAAYDLSGGHSSIRGTLHDGLKLPRAYRLAGLRTDIFDANDLAACRMYHTPAAVWNGLARNAVEALASPRLIVPMSAILLLGQVAPACIVAAGLTRFPRPWDPALVWWAFAALVASYSSRWALAIRFRQSRLGALLHPLGILVLVAIQWYALARNLAGRPSAWKGRLYRSPQAFDPSRGESPAA
jgi:Glycosyl transferase family 2